MSGILIRPPGPANPATTNSNNFEIKFVDTLQGNWLVKWATLPNSIYNVNSTNNVIYWTSGFSGALSATVPPGHYSGATLAATMEPLMETADGGGIDYSVTYDSTTAKFTITSVAVISMTFGTNTVNSISEVIGFYNVDTVSGNLQGSGKVVSLGLPLSIGIAVDDVHTRGYWTADQKHGSIYVPIATDFGSYQLLSPDILEQTIEMRYPMRTLSFRLVDTKTNAVVDINESEWEMLLERIGPFVQ